ncbi:MAG: AMP-binding protein [Cyclobacteriaceae bacterium]
MLLTFLSDNTTVNIDTLLNSKVSQLKSEYKYIKTFVANWEADVHTFSFKTSGSTSSPKNIVLTKDQLTYSARQTLNHLNLNKGGKSLLCIPPQFMGGTMVLVRSIINQMDIDIMTPSSTFPQHSYDYDLASMVPLQLQSILNTNPNYLNQFRHLLIGGAPLNESLEKQLLDLNLSVNIYATFGMTETASHFAIRKIGETEYQLLGDIIASTDTDGCLSINGTVTNHQLIQTNDIVSLSTNRFKWIGRRDFIINTGGFKVSPELVEQSLSKQIAVPFVISSVPDIDYGSKVVLVHEGPYKPEVDFQEIHPYMRPKQLFQIDHLPRTKTDKFDRKAVSTWLLDQSNNV